jgi:hypothetical protein
MRSGIGIDADQLGELEDRRARIQEDRGPGRQVVGGIRDRALGGKLAFFALLKCELHRRPFGDAGAAVHTINRTFLSRICRSLRTVASDAPMASAMS